MLPAIPQWLLFTFAGAGALAVLVVLAIVFLVAFVWSMAAWELRRKRTTMHRFKTEKEAEAEFLRRLSVDNPTKVPRPASTPSVPASPP